MSALVVEALFAVVFARAAGSYLRGRDPLQRDVMLVFGSVAGLFVLDLVRRLGVEPPRLVSDLGSALLLAQPALTLRLVARLRAVPLWLRWAAAVGWAASALFVVTLRGRIPPVAVLVAIVAVFCVVEAVAATFLVREAARRTGSSRVRLWCAAAGTVLFALALMTAAAGPEGAAAAQLTALVSAGGFGLAFLPPYWLRQVWAARAAYLVIRRLLNAPADEQAASTWRHYAETVGQLSAADAGVVVVPGADGGPSEVARFGIPGPADEGGPDEPGPWTAPADARDLETLLQVRGTWDARTVSGDGPGGRLVSGLVTQTGARYVTAARLPLPDGRYGALVLFNSHRSLFSDDDVQLFGELGGQAAVIAERQALAAELATVVEAATQASRAKSAFLASMSHELRTPLNAIIGFSDLMRDERAVGDDRLVSVDWISHVNASGEHLLGLINDVLDLAKVESGHLELHPQLLDASAAVDESLTMLAPLVDGKRLEVIVAVPPIPLCADPVRLRQILTNLLSNAIKYTPEGGRIFVSAHRADGQVQLSVTDTGPGIALADQQRVFEEFQQVGDPVMHKAGTGLGLALTRRLVLAHGGRIELRSEPGHGARFTVYLPAPTSSGAGTASEPVGTGDGPPVPGSGGILIVEDNAAAAELLATHLRRAGYPVHVAGSGEAGLAVAATAAPDVVLLDVQLPGIDGWEVMRRLKGDARLRHIPVAVISVADQQSVGLAMGAADYFVKPINHDALLAWLIRNGMIPPLTRDVTTALVIDDDPAILALLDGALTQHGLRVVGAGSGADGLRLARRHSFDLIICDLMMPDIDGFTVVAALHDDPATRGVPVLILTGHDLTDADKARLSGKILGIATKGTGASSTVRAWVDRITHPAGHPFTGAAH